MSVVIPVYNERRYIAHVLARVQAVPSDKEIVVVDDASTDGTKELLESIHRARQENQPFIVLAELIDPLRIDNIVVCFQPKNCGKGAALRRGFQMANSAVVIVQDADLEYDPNDYDALTAPIVSGRADVVYGSRFMNGRPPGPWLSVAANRALTATTNILYGGRLTDMETCYKIMRMPVARSLQLQSNRFDIEPEITAKLLRQGCRILERPVRFDPRSRANGKKIGWRDGFHAIAVLVKYRFQRIRPDNGRPHA